ncbi:hypothetical protein ASPWEDRAFT_105127 [Aspergillus wentii DTO 134E9]|uniref:Haemolysin-III related n=1 Tax=Aspergillus wentii DTO 134E9 TaxID=1073089 RepID=A0A1L9RT87_ASPWE|nr:uncharacterized protein ASPWEDRAFT_105127 [Aspergillus wentii DTO 134E9]KAI9933795.1 hypothetical protein MW887_004867 [Aspergillus wentii]OJJ38139.1 hypothetical protein ASPWEDRAFT_105127 [Aspergillus wentii DTO 134E9]
MVVDALLRFRRTPPEQKATPHKDHPAESPRQQHLLTIAELPSWYDANPFILSGYRPESQSWWSSLSSWRYWHNESCNIYSHLIPGLLSLLGQGSLYDYLRVRYTNLSTFDWFIIALQLLTGTICLLTSSLFHTVLNHSAPVAYQWLQFDYVGIIVLILGNFISGLHFGFYCDPGLKHFYWFLILAFSSATAITLLSPRFTGPEWRSFRLASFICTGLSAFAPIGHAWVLWGPEYLAAIGVPYYLLEGVFLIIGCYFWERMVPERLFPGKFDIIGQSHTIWHVFVVLSIGAHIHGLLSALDYVYNEASCRVV